MYIIPIKSPLCPQILAFFVAAQLFVAPVAAQVPTISGITVTVDTNEATVAFATSAALPYCWVQYGVASGTYLWGSVSYQADVSNTCSIPITGLKDSTTYYFLPSARPDPDDETNICNVSACGAVEQSATTPSSSVSHSPAPPNSVQSNLLVAPNTTGADATNVVCAPNCYITVPLVDGGSGVGHECVAAGTYSYPSGYSVGTPSVTAGQTLTSIIASGAVVYGMVFAVAQGAVCIVPSYPSYGHGYNLLPVPAIDPLASSITDPKHRWVVFSTQVISATDFPPFGVRTSPSYFAKMGTFKSANPNTIGIFGTSGSAFSMVVATGQYHHWAFTNLQFQVDETQFAEYDAYLVFDDAGNGRTSNWSQYLIVEGNHFQGEPSRASNLSANGGLPWIGGMTIKQYQPNMQLAIVGNYADNFYWSPVHSQYPVGFNFGDGAAAGGGPVLIDNNYVSGMGEPIYLEVDKHLQTNPYDFTISHNSAYMPIGTLAYAQANPGVACGRAVIEAKGLTRGLFSGNYVNGQWACLNFGASILALNTIDLTVSSNLIRNAASVFSFVGNNTYAAQGFKTVGNRIAATNNYAYSLGRSLFQAGALGVQTVFAEVDSALNNLNISNNTVGNMNGGTSPAYDPLLLVYAGGGPAAGLTITNNVLPFGMAGLGGILAQNVAQGIASHPASPATLNPSPVSYVTALASFGGYTDGAAGLGMTATSTIAGGSGYSDGNLSFTNCGTSPTATYTVTGSSVQYSTFTGFGVCSAVTMTASAGAGGASLRPHYGLTSSYVWGGNINFCTANSGVDMSQAQCTSFTSTMPLVGSPGTGNLGAGDLYAPGSTTAARETAAGYANIDSGIGTCTPTTTNPSCSAGANMSTLEIAQGIVSGISSSATSTTGTISYTAPDSRSCSVEISSDGITWTRQTDPGGTRSRSLTFTGLTFSTAYQYRLLCYFDQSEGASAGWFSFPSDSSNLATDGMFVTVGSQYSGTFSGVMK